MQALHMLFRKMSNMSISTVVLISYRVHKSPENLFYIEAIINDRHLSTQKAEICRFHTKSN
jgi:hypothetical protein